jgi:hypothetical protein
LVAAVAVVECLAWKISERISVNSVRGVGVGVVLAASAFATSGRPRVGGALPTLP